jgi:hypothetical protein
MTRGLSVDVQQELSRMRRARIEREGKSTANSGSADVVSSPWPTMDEIAYYGLAGDVVKTIEPHTEADPVALLLQFLTLAGNAVGHAPYHLIESDRHHTNLFVTLVGDTAKARKGTSLGRCRAVIRIADEQWANDRFPGGLSSGEGLIYAVRDPGGDDDPGVGDKRLMIIEPEFAHVLSATERHGNNLSPIIRRAWDGDKLQTLTKNSPLCATEAHISIVSHITVDELRARLTRTEMANGFANRFLFALVKRSKKLPFGGDLSDSQILGLGDRGRYVIENMKTFGRVRWAEAAAQKWKIVYDRLSESSPGLLGAITARAEAQTLRLALIYSLLDGRGEIDEPHLEAALAVWDYCDASAAFIFGDSLGDPIADDIERALRTAGAEGMTRTAISNVLGNNRSADRIGAALGLLMKNGRARAESKPTGGRPVETWFAIAKR